MNVLFITTDNYPHYGTSTGIIKKLIFEGKMLQQVDSVTILSEKNSNDKSFEIVNNVKLIRYISVYSAQTKFILKDETIGTFRKMIFLIKKIYIKYIEKHTKNSFLKTIHIYEIYKSLIKIKAYQYDIIIPIFGNYDAAIATIKFKQKYPKSHVILYQVDPFSTNWVVNKSYVPKYQRIEKELYSFADAIITLPYIYQEAKNISFKEDLYKFNIVELPLVSKRNHVDCVNNFDKPICLFSGLIYGNIRDPKYTIRLFKDLIEKDLIELWFAGVEKNELPHEFKELNIKCFGRVSINDANSLIDQADVLVNIGNLMNNQIPSKIFDYVSTGKPIINICKNYDCPTLSYVNKYHLCLNLFEDNEKFIKQQEKMREFIKNNYKKRIKFDKIEETYSECTPMVCSDKLLEVFSKIGKV